MKTIYFDIDGTLFDPQHRLHFISGHSKDWNSFNENIPFDTPIEETIWLNNQLAAAGHKIIIGTGRSENERTVTEEQLKSAGVIYHKMYMRPAGDYRPDYIIKKEMLAQMKAEGNDPFFGLDDRQSVTDALREEGMTIFQCSPQRGECRSDVYQFHPMAEFPLVIMVGPSGAGKSSFVEMNFTNVGYQVISTDNIRHSINADPTDQAQGDRVHRIKLEMASKWLKEGCPVVIDATNIRRKDRVECAKLLPQDIPVAYVVVNRPLEEKIATAGHRTEEIIRRHDQVFRSNLKDILNGDDLPNVTIFDNRS